jgi:PIN domain nuclease of toxin-antitoxin system
MALLLDTHAVLWYVIGSPELSETARNIIDAQSELVFSIASVWEISIKLNIGKLQLNCSFDDLLVRVAVMRAEILPISIEDTRTYIDLPLPSKPKHRDPFDRILIAQAINNSLTIVSADAAFDIYPIQRVWA